MDLTVHSGRMDRKGQIVIPSAIRDELGLAEGTIIEMRLIVSEDTRALVLRPAEIVAREDLARLKKDDRKRRTKRRAAMERIGKRYAKVFKKLAE